MVNFRPHFSREDRGWMDPEDYNLKSDAVAEQNAAVLAAQVNHSWLGVDGNCIAVSPHPPSRIAMDLVRSLKVSPLELAWQREQARKDAEDEVALEALERAYKGRRLPEDWCVRPKGIPDAEWDGFSHARSRRYSLVDPVSG